ncbi:MAG: hypothetical protein LLG40_16000 [Deltaproteobacteria bacterium]|nr:hypothetical protein [Deltaproteobacteria bacterium]
MNNTTLENSIREEAARAIAVIKEKEADEIRKLNEDYALKINDFRKKSETETQTRIDQELSRLENRAILERRKLTLTSVEQFISRMVDEVMKEIRSNPLYGQFILNSIGSIVNQVPAGVEVRLNKDDLVLEKEILATTGAQSRSNSVIIKEDPKIKWGGCLVLDEAGSRIFNNTMERIYFRKSLLIRQKVMSLLTDHSRDENNPNFPEVKI